MVSSGIAFQPFFSISLRPILSMRWWIKSVRAGLPLRKFSHCVIGVSEPIGGIHSVNAALALAGQMWHTASINHTV